MSEQKPAGRTIGFRDLLRDVNLRDFADMVRGEFRLVGEAARASWRSSPLTFPFVLIAVLVRLVLLLAVLLVFGTGILLISAVRVPVRWIGALLRGGRGGAAA